MTDLQNNILKLLSTNSFFKKYLIKFLISIFLKLYAANSCGFFSKYFDFHSLPGFLPNLSVIGLDLLLFIFFIVYFYLF